MQTVNQLTKTMPQLNSQANPMQTSWQNETKQPMTHGLQNLLNKVANPQQTQMVLDLFTMWKQLYQSKMKNPENWNLHTAQAWSVALTDLKMTQQEFALACQKSLSQEWFPTAPYDFLALARTASEYPNSRLAFQTACQNEGKTADSKQAYEHVVIYETVKRLGGYALKNADDRYFATWNEVYQQVLTEHKNGADFTLPESQQVTYERTVADSEVADDYLAQMFAVVGKEAVA